MSLLARLIEAGTPAALIGEVAMLLAEKKLSDAAISDRRAKDRDRQERKRSRDVTDCHVTECDNGNGAFPAPPMKENLTPPPIPPDNTSRARKADHFLPENWKPTEFSLGTESRAVVDGWPPGEAKRQLEHFAAHHEAKGNKFNNWQKAWSTWVLNKRDFGNGQRNGHQTIRGSGGNGPDKRTGIAKACDGILAGEFREVH